MAKHLTILENRGKGNVTGSLPIPTSPLIAFSFSSVYFLIVMLQATVSLPFIDLAAFFFFFRLLVLASKQFS